MFTACSSKTETKIEEINNYVSHKKNGINLIYEAKENLNLYNSNAHSLIFTVYQLKDITNFNLIIQEDDSIEKLIYGSKFDSNVLTYNSYIIQPNSKDIIRMDRVKEAKWVVLLAGYFNYINKSNVFKSYKIKLIEQYSIYEFFAPNIEYNILDLNIVFKENSFVSNEIITNEKI
jgi:predicted component of type VI protein secretion system